MGSVQLCPKVSSPNEQCLALLMQIPDPFVCRSYCAGMELELALGLADPISMYKVPVFALQAPGAAPN